MKAEYKILKEANLTNNCPVCYANDSMVISFKQKKIEIRFDTQNLKGSRRQDRMLKMSIPYLSGYMD